MQPRDIIRDEIEQLGRVMGKIVAEFLDLKSKGDLTIAIQVTKEQFSSKLDLDLSKLVQLTSGELEKFLEGRRLSYEQIDQLAELLYEMACSQETLGNTSEYLLYLQTSNNLITIADRQSKTWTFNRETLKKKVAERVSDYQEE